MSRRVLTEKFNETMPGWLRKRLLYSDNRSPRDVGPQTQDEHPRKRGNAHISEGLFKEFIRKNIDLNRAKFISVDPKSLQRRNDPRLSDPYLPIFHIVTYSPGMHTTINTVYAMGINDNDKWPSWSANDEFYDKAFRSIPLKRLIELSEDFCYIDLSDPTNLIDEEKKFTRANNASDRVGNWERYVPVKRGLSSYFLPRAKDTGRFKEDDGIYWTEDRFYRKYDKSGYIKNPNKFDAALKKLKAKNYSKVLNNLYSRIKTVQVGMTEAFSDYNFKNLTGNISSGAFSSFQALVNAYNKLVQNVDYMVKKYNGDPDLFTDQIQRVFDIHDYSYGDNYLVLLNTLRNLESQVADYINVPIDWDVEEDEGDFTESLKLRLSERLFEDIDNFNDVDDLQPVENAVMASAVQQNRRVRNNINTALRNSRNSVKNGFTGAYKQPVPDSIKQPKVELDENLFK